MKKRVLSLVCALALALSLLPAAQALEGEGDRAAQTLAALGLVNGTPAGYDADAPATQEQAAALLVRLLGAEKTAAADKRNCGWKNVPRWAWSAVNYCAYHGLIDPLEYQPNAELSAELWCSMLLRAIGEEEAGGSVNTARRIGLISFPLEGTLTRSRLFETALGALTFSRADGSSLLDGLIAWKFCTEETAVSLGLRSELLSAREAADRHMAAGLQLDLYESEKAIEKEKPSANASAFLISTDGLAVTNYHSIDGAIAGTATLVTGEVFSIDRVLYYDEDVDLAVIRISRTTKDGVTVPRFSFVTLAGTEDVRVGDKVYAIGNPLGLGLAMSQGIISSTSHEATLSSLPCFVSDATISRGSSGGALFNERGQAIAVTTGAYAYGNNMYLCVPVAPAMEADLSGEGQTLEEVLEAVTAARETEAEK